MGKVGRIIKGIGGFYTVLLEGGETVTCKARGRFRNEGVTPMVGDLVEISLHETGFAALDDILPRTNALLRPPVANIDLLVIVLSASVPKPDFLLADKLLIQAQTLKIEPLIVLNKMDRAAGDIEAVAAELRAGGETVAETCALSGEGFPELLAAVKKRLEENGALMCIIITARCRTPVTMAYLTANRLEVCKNVR